MRLGTQSEELLKLLNEQRDFQKQALKNKDAVLDLFDTYISAGEIPAEIKDELIRTDDVAELYRLNRNYAPADIGRRFP